MDGDPYIVENFPFDKYELEPCPLSAALLAHKHGVCWPVFVPGSGGGGPSNLGEAFGYLKVRSNCYCRTVALCRGPAHPLHVATDTQPTPSTR